MSKTSLFCGILSIGMLSIGYSQKKSEALKVQNLQEVVVSDSRFELKRENSGKTVIKISKSEIEKNQGRSVAQLINTKSGIEINGSRSVAGQNLGYFVRGGNNRQVLVLIDGLQVNDPSLVSNDFDLRLLNLNTIESIEIIKGAASTLYGNSAAAAVINITTKKASNDTISGSFLSVIGTNQTQDNQNYNVQSFTNSVSVNGTLDKFSYLASFGNQFSDGLSAAQSENPEVDPFSRYNTNMKLGYTLNNHFKITAYASYDRFKTGIDGFPPPNFSLADTDDQFNSEQTRVGISPKFTYNRGSFEINAAFTGISRETISGNSTQNNAKSLVVDAFNKYTIDDELYTILGFNYGDYRSEFNKEESFTTTDPYLNLVYISDFGLTMNAGLRLNNHSTYGSQFVYNLNPSYALKHAEGYTKIFGSYATSFIAPNLSQLFGFFGPNPNLEPEENRTLEGGLEYNNNRGLRLSSVYFNRVEENTIIFTTAYENATEDATVQGLEFEAEWQTFKNVTLTANYTFTEIKDGIRLRVPKHKANAFIEFSFSKSMFASLQYQYVGSRTDIDFSNFSNVELKPFSLFNLQFRKKIIQDKMKVFINLDNILNENYTEILGYSTLGRNVSLGFDLNL
ncbi:TonB-dependent receptor [Winogradskyella sp. DF17]|uniref:TonB-dependent receptor n=1 Tax=Winogradskyella pelagia TaxID=2819984 RepID=A0ABS3SZW3_9FLAO|nr:TonB-dependent receptor [Winogradskyella sp. DF17]MBO3116025.1 TonB-dependent receptor [Winogradskyella sp. DF17]